MRQRYKCPQCKEGFAALRYEKPENAPKFLGISAQRAYCPNCGVRLDDNIFIIGALSVGLIAFSISIKISSLIILWPLLYLLVQPYILKAKPD